MSRGKKPTKADKRLRKMRRQLQQAKDERRVAAKVEALSCAHGAADDLSILCGSAYEHTGYDVDTVVAAEHLWRRAAPQHPLTPALGELRVELERHRAAMLAFLQRFDAMVVGATPHHDHLHLQPNADDLSRIRFAVLGGDDPESSSSQPAS